MSAPTTMADAMTAQEVASTLGLSSRAIYDLAKSGALPHFRYGPRAIRFSRQDVTNYQQACRYHATKNAIAGYLSLTASSLGKGVSALESVFQEAGASPKQKPLTAKKRHASTP